MTVKAEMERALRNRGFEDGRGGKPIAFPGERSYLDSYQHGQDARRRDAQRRGGHGRAAEKPGPSDDRPLAPPPPIPPRP